MAASLLPVGAALPALPPRVLPRRRPVARLLGLAILRLMGWTWTGGFPNQPRMMLIGAPHTSNWDGVVGLAAAAACEIDVRVLAKAELFRFPFGGIMRWLGIVPVQRDAPGGLVEQAIVRLSGPEPSALGITPEGTRGRVERWKTGFHRIAVAANVPIVVVGIDWGRKQIGVNGAFYPTGDLATDLDTIATLLDGVVGKHPDRDSPIRLEADASSTQPA
ncbi:MAG: lysophosphatidylcholine acyltransferase [Rubricoccaceae bacterium]